MTLLKHGDFVFGHILSGGYNILEDEPDVIKEVKMGDGTIKRNYRDMPKTSIKIKFGRLNKETYTEYMSHFANNEDIYSFYSPRQGQLLSKKFL